MTRPRRLLSSTSRFSPRAADPQPNTTSSVLPASLDVLLPACSKACLRAFIKNNYPSSSSTDINTLCTNNTSSGFTLGEAALICESAYCTAHGQVDKSIFSICDSVPQAIRPSHDSLTVVPMATSQLTPGSNAFSAALPPTIGAPASTNVDATKITSATGAPSVPETSNAAPTPSPSPPSSSTSSSTPSPSSEPPSPSTPTSVVSSTLPTSATITRPGQSDANITSASSPTVTPAGSQAQGSLNTGQIVGISLAALAIFGFVVGLLLFLWYRRRERGQIRRGSRWSEVIEKHHPPSFPPGEPQVELGLSNPRAATPDHSQRFYAPPTTTQEKRRSFWRKSIKAEDIGVAVSPEIAQAGSPTSISSQRTISQLLPELPHYSLWPAPLRQSQQLLVTPEYRQESARPTVTFASTLVESKKTKKAPRIVSGRTGNGLPTDPRAQMYRLEQAKSANSKIPLTPVYDNGNVPTTFGAILASRGTALLHPGYAPRLQSQRDHDPRLHPPTITQARVNTPPRPLQPALATAQIQTARSRPAPPMRRQSSSSDTTNIEDDEDITPEQETDKQLGPPPPPPPPPQRLSPVIESPHPFPNSPMERLTTPLKDLTYPSPPRSAAISKQAEKPPRPRLTQFIDATGTIGPPSSRSLTPAAAPAATARSSRRDQLVLDRRSFLATASSTTSSHSRNTRDESPSSLLAKRKGDWEADQMLQGGLRLSATAANAKAAATAAGGKWYVRNASPGVDAGQGRGRKGSDTENNVDMVLKTPESRSGGDGGGGGGGLKSPPAWTPRLTPTRRGTDLYLRVE